MRKTCKKSRYGTRRVLGIPATEPHHSQKHRSFSPKSKPPFPRRSANGAASLPNLFMQKLSLERVRTVLVARLGVFPVTLWRDATRACSNAFACHRLGIHASEHVSVLNTRDTEFKGRKRSKNTSKKKTIYFVTVQLRWK